MIPIEAGLVGFSTSLAETVIYSDSRGWAGRIDYQAYVRTPSVGTLLTTFRWRDRGGNLQSHQTLALSLLAPGVLVQSGFQLWTQNADPSTVTLQLTLAGLIGTPVIDFFANGFGLSYD